MTHSIPAASEPGSDCPTPCVLRVVEAACKRSTTSSAPIAEALCLSVTTVDTYFERAMRCARVHDRGGAVIEAIKRGWVKIEVLKTASPRAEPSPAAGKKRILRAKKRKCRDLPT